MEATPYANLSFKDITKDFHDPICANFDEAAHAIMLIIMGMVNLEDELNERVAEQFSQPSRRGRPIFNVTAMGGFLGLL